MGQTIAARQRNAAARAQTFAAKQRSAAFIRIDDGVEARSSMRGIKAKGNSDGRDKSASQDDRPEADEDGPVSIPGNRDRRGSSQQHADKPAD